MKTPNGLAKMDRMCPLILMHRTTFSMVGLLWNGNELVCLLHWRWERLSINCSNQLPPLKPSYAKAKCWMHLRDFAWPLVKSPFISEQRCEMQIASGPLIECGTMFISWMLRLENASPYIYRLRPLCNILQSTRSIWGCFRTLQMTT